MDTSSRPLGQQERLKFRSFFITYNNQESVKQTLTEIFTDCTYQFLSKKETPFIIDAGSNIGIATLFFKSLYPSAKILCFEPDPNAFRLLQINIADNKMEKITLVNAALAREAKAINFFGQIFVDSPDNRGNSIIEAWGLQRNRNSIA